MNDDLPTRRVSADERDTVRVSASSREVVFQRYELQRKLAAGGMGEVWLARDTVQGTDAALKFLKEDFATDAQAVNELKQEVLNSLKLGHQNILKVYRFEVDEAAAQITRRYAISMEYIRGMNLRDLRRDRKIDYFDVEELLPWVLQTCDAIHYAHERKLVHRDIKPANLMLDEHNAIKVCDFGIGRAVTETSSGRTQNNAGTIPYMSRQQREFYKAAPADDIYAIGATIYDLLTGHPPRYTGKQVAIPFDEKPPRMAEWRKRNKAKGSDQPIPENWERVVELCLCDEAAGRPPTAKAVRDLLEGRPVEIKTPPVGKTAGGTGKGTVSRTVVAAGLAVVLGLAAAGGYYYWANNIRMLPEVQQLVATGRVSPDEGDKLNAVLRGPDGYEKKLAARLSTGAIDPATWRVYSPLIPAPSEVVAKLRPLLVQGSISEEEFNLLVKDLNGPDNSPYKNLAKQLAYEKTIRAEQWRDSRTKIVDPSLEKVKLLVSTGTLTTSEGETLTADHSKTDGGKEAALARRLLEENAITVEQWRKDRFPAPAGPAVDPITERLKPLAAAGNLNAQEVEWLHDTLAGRKTDSEKALAERLLSQEITPGVWRARTTFDYRLKDDVVLDPANLPPAIDLALNESTNLRLLRVDPGSFLRGAAKEELGRRPNELSPENVTVTRPYYLGIHEVTQAQYLALMPRNPSYWRNNPNWPVDQVDWQSITSSNGFLARLNAKLGTRQGSLFVADLPTEDEWEYACRAGTQTSFNNGKNITNAFSDPALDLLANYNRAANGSPRDVGSFQPNAWGYFDMHGNVSEWCQNRFIRGGSWQSRAANCRVAWRTQLSAEALGSNQTGFRLALHLKDKDTK